MHRPQAFGAQQLVDMSSEEYIIPILTANFGTVAALRPAYNVVTDTTVVKNEQAVSFRQDSAETWSLPALDNFSFGRFISGEAKDERPMHINVGCSMFVRGNLTCDVYMAIGRLTNSAPVVDLINAGANPMDNVHRINGRISNDGSGNYRIDCSCTIIDGLFDGESSTFESNPIGVFVNVFNLGAAVNLTELHGSLWAYKFDNEISTFEPNR